MAANRPVAAKCQPKKTERGKDDGKEDGKKDGKDGNQKKMEKEDGMRKEDGK